MKGNLFYWKQERLPTNASSMIRKLLSNLSKQSLSILQQQIRLFSKLWKQETISMKAGKLFFNLWQFKYNAGGCVNVSGVG